VYQRVRPYGDTESKKESEAKIALIKSTLSGEHQGTVRTTSIPSRGDAPAPNLTNSTSYRFYKLLTLLY
jgi:hypothetical protein